MPLLTPPPGHLLPQPNQLWHAHGSPLEDGETDASAGNSGGTVQQFVQQGSLMANANESAYDEARMKGPPTVPPPPQPQPQQEDPRDDPNSGCGWARQADDTGGFRAGFGNGQSHVGAGNAACGSNQRPMQRWANMPSLTPPPGHLLPQPGQLWHPQRSSQGPSQQLDDADEEDMGHPLIEGSTTSSLGLALNNSAVENQGNNEHWRAQSASMPSIPQEHAAGGYNTLFTNQADNWAQDSSMMPQQDPNFQTYEQWGRGGNSGSSGFGPAFVSFGNRGQMGNLLGEEGDEQMSPSAAAVPIWGNAPGLNPMNCRAPGTVSSPSAASPGGYGGRSPNSGCCGGCTPEGSTAMMPYNASYFARDCGGQAAAAGSADTRWLGWPEQLFDAVTRSDIDAIQEMLREGADVNANTERGSHVLFRAVIKAQGPEIVQLLLEANADVMAMDEKGNSVLHFWARATVGRNHLVTIGECLARAGADFNAQRKTDGMSPLHHVAIGHNNRRGWLDFHKALFLLRHGANPTIVTQKWQTPFDLLAKDSRPSTKRLAQLLQYGINGIPTSWQRCEHSDCVWCNW
eukprot:TRINITY_DN44503_c0_g1_i1.p1 TRINITY_DN44503_c0_g1~~TRINITY_DN44503_c0_g1_i1.p1  ORF type:complete len:605 (-),score=125.68 TRINITY_DN44503_c0_g1_i1:42-1757(-)